MQTCDVLVVGGGPAGSTCARHLTRAGVDALVADKSDFPRDKVCAGWITPEVVRVLDLDLVEYASARTLQAFTGFETSLFGGHRRLTSFGRTISFGIRRCEFDAYLLDRAGARRTTGTPVAALRRDDSCWIVDERIRARIVVGAGGHFCPVARWLNRGAGDEGVVVAQEFEVPVDASPADASQIHAEWPELIFWPDLQGYGWCVRKGGFLNVGAGRLTRTQFPAAVREFSGLLERRGILAAGAPVKWKGHAYLLNRTSRRRLHAPGVVLVGDAAGLALAPSGEGILAAVESGQIAAETIVEALASHAPDRLDAFERHITARFGRSAPAARAAGSPPRWLSSAAGTMLLASRWLTRRVLLEDWFLHMHRPAMVPGRALIH